MKKIKQLTLIGLAAMGLAGILSFPAPCQPPHEMEQPEWVPPSLLGLLEEQRALDREFERLRNRMDSRSKPDEPPGEPGGWEPWRYRAEAENLGKGHKVFREMEELQEKRMELLRRAWETFREEVHSGTEETELPAPGDRMEAFGWMRRNFGMILPPMPPERPDEPGSFYRKSFEHRLEKRRGKGDGIQERLEQLEDRVERQDQEIRELRERIQTLEGGNSH